MSILSSLAREDNIQTDKDSLGEGGILESGLYNCVVEIAYLSKSQSGAAAMNLHLKTDDGKTIRQTFYITSGEAKGCLPYYVNKKGEKAYLPGYNQATALAELAAGKPLHELDTAEKTIKLYDYSTREEVPTAVEMVMDLLNKPVYIGLLKITENKREKQGDTYVATSETRDINEIDKIFRHPDKCTWSEARSGETEGSFVEKWLEKHEGVTRDKTTKNVSKGSGSTGTQGAPSKPSAAERKNIFAD